MRSHIMETQRTSTGYVVKCSCLAAVVGEWDQHTAARVAHGHAAFPGVPLADIARKVVDSPES